MPVIGLISGVLVSEACTAGIVVRGNAAKAGWVFSRINESTDHTARVVVIQNVEPGIGELWGYG
jgi:hypothetical protein